MRIEINNLQALVHKSSHLPFGRYLIFNFPESDNAKRFLEKLEPLVTPAGEEYQQLLNIGISYFGLEAMGLPAEVLSSFPVAFSNPLRSDIRETVGDIGRNAPENWWGKKFKPEDVHCLVHLFALETANLEALTTQVRQFASNSGVVEKVPSIGNFQPNTIDLSWPYELGVLHFGFKDGFSQPRVSWEEPMPQVREDEEPFVSFRQFLIGYKTGSNQDIQRDWFQDSTYTAFRWLQQDIDGFENYLERNADKVSRAFPGSGESDEEKKENRKAWLAAKMFGRWRDGTPLTLSPDKPQEDLAKEYFSYKQQDDLKGLKCPLTSHIRLTNPRDQGGFKSGALKNFDDVPRLIRRGAPFGPAWQRGDNVPRGIAGLFLTSDLEAVELIMSWMQRPADFTMHIKAPGGGEFFQDPIVGNRVGNGNCVFKFKGGEKKRRVKVSSLSEFVLTIGAANLLMPSFSTLKRLIHGDNG